MMRSRAHVLIITVSMLFRVFDVPDHGPHWFWHASAWLVTGLTLVYWWRGGPLWLRAMWSMWAMVTIARAVSYLFVDPLRWAPFGTAIQAIYFAVTWLIVEHARESKGWQR